MFRLTILSAAILLAGSAHAQAQSYDYEVYENVVGAQSACGCSSASACDCGRTGLGIGDRLRGIGRSYFNPLNGKPGTYFKVFGGTNTAHDFTELAGGIPVRSSFRDGFMYGTARGRQIAPNVRLELESTFRKNSFDQISGPGLGSADQAGRIDVTSVMMNTIFNADRCILGTTPYVGLGVGGAYVDVDSSIPGTTFDVDELTFAYQALIGTERQLSSRVNAFAEYRYMGTSDFDVDANSGGPFTFERDYTAENFVFGFRFKR